MVIITIYTLLAGGAWRQRGGREARESLLRTAVDARLIASAVPVRQLDGPAAHREGKELIPKANTKNRGDNLLFFRFGERFFQYRDRIRCFGRVTWSVGEKETVVILVGVVVVPRDDFQGDIEPHKLPDDVEFHPAVDRDDLLGALA